MVVSSYVQTQLEAIIVYVVPAIAWEVTSTRVTVKYYDYVFAVSLFS